MFDELSKDDRKKFYWYLFVSMPLGIMIGLILSFLLAHLINFHASLGLKFVLALTVIAIYIYGAFNYYRWIKNGKKINLD